jgi:hypothetical protein
VVVIYFLEARELSGKESGCKSREIRSFVVRSTTTTLVQRSCARKIDRKGCLRDSPPFSQKPPRAAFSFKLYETPTSARHRAIAP